METISRTELRERLDRSGDLKLVTALGEFGFRAKRIPGSLCFQTPEEALGALAPSDEIVVYCANEECPASIFAALLLESRGYRHVARYAGGLADWECAGWALEGELVPPP
jgi:rhodanese-related sulfurtransferase